MSHGWGIPKRPWREGWRFCTSGLSTCCTRLLALAPCAQIPLVQKENMQNPLHPSPLAMTPHFSAFSPSSVLGFLPPIPSVLCSLFPVPAAALAVVRGASFTSVLATPWDVLSLGH